MIQLFINFLFISIYNFICIAILKLIFKKIKIYDILLTFGKYKKLKKQYIILILIFFKLVKLFNI